MVEPAKYHDTLTQVLHAEVSEQPSRGLLRIIPVCDPETRQYLLVALGWSGKRRVDNIVFHARLAQGKIIIEDDNIEGGLAPALREAGVPEEDILLSWRFNRGELEQLAA